MRPKGVFCVILEVFMNKFIKPSLPEQINQISIIQFADEIENLKHKIDFTDYLTLRKWILQKCFELDIEFFPLTG